MAKGDILQIVHGGPSDSTVTIAFSATPNSGDLLIFISQIYAGSDASGCAMSLATEVVDSVESGHEDSAGFRRMQFFARACGGSESNSYAVTATAGTWKNVIAYRIEGVFADLSGITASPEQYSKYVTTLAIPASAIAYSANSLAIVGCDVDSATVSFSGFGTAEQEENLFTATTTVTGSGTLQTTATFAAEATDVSGAMILIQTGAGGGGSFKSAWAINSNVVIR